jgi:hypothetical protein
MQGISIPFFYFLFIPLSIFPFRVPPCNLHDVRDTQKPQPGNTDRAKLEK